MAASASKSTYLYFLLVNEFKHDDDYENQNMNYAEWIEEGYNKIPQVKSNASQKYITGSPATTRFNLMKVNAPQKDIKLAHTVCRIQ